MLSPLNVTARTKKAMNLSTLSIKAHVGEEIFKLASTAIFNDDMKYAELTRISDSLTGQLKRPTQFCLKVKSVSKKV